MKKIMITWIAIMLIGATPAGAGSIHLFYRVTPGQTWLCTQATVMEFMIMGKKQVRRDKNTIVYKVSKGPQKGWVHLTAQYVNPPERTDENKFALQKYDLVVSADMHRSGEVRHVKISGTDTPSSDPSMTPAEQQMYIQSKQSTAQMWAPAFFWFPELPQDSIAPGDEFEDRRKDNQKQKMMSYKADYRNIFTLEEVSRQLAYFDVRVRMAIRTKAGGQNITSKSAGKGEAVFDLKTGMWTELVTKQKMSSAGGTMMGSSNQPLLITYKVTMQRQ